MERFIDGDMESEFVTDEGGVPKVRLTRHFLEPRSLVP